MSNYQRRKEEERAGVFRRPVSIAGLQSGEEVYGSAESGGGRLVGDVIAVGHFDLGYRLFEILLMQELRFSHFLLIILIFNVFILLHNPLNPTCVNGARDDRIKTVNVN